MEKKFLDKQGLAEVSKGLDDKYASKDDFSKFRSEVYTNTNSELMGAVGMLSSQIDSKADKSAIPAKLSQLKEDETHKVVTQEEKDNWDKKLDENSDISKNQVTYNYTGVMPKVGNRIYKIKDYGNTTDTLGRVLSDQSEDIAKLYQATQNAEYVATLDENKKIPIEQIPDGALKNTPSATFVIANYDSSENSKAGADYVVKENESPCDVINSFIAKLPSYGGKIQLTEGNFIENTATYISIGESRKHVILSGYGYSTQLKSQAQNPPYYLIRIDGVRNSVENLSMDDTSQATVYIGSKAEYTTIRNCFILSRKGVGVTISADQCSMAGCMVASISSVAILIGASQTQVIDCYAETIMNDDMGCIQFHFTAQHSVVSNCNVRAKRAIGIEVLGNYNSVIGCYVMSETRISYNLAGKYSTASNCIGDSKDNITFAMTGVGNKFIGCTAHATGESRGMAFSTGGKSRHCVIENCNGISDHKYAFGIAGQNNSVTNCVADAKAGNGFILGGSGHTLSNCSSIGGTETGIYSMAEGAVFSNCVVTNKEGVSVSAIELSSNAKNNWCVGTRVYGGAVTNSGTGNTVERTIKIPAPLKEETA